MNDRKRRNLFEKLIEPLYQDTFYFIVSRVRNKELAEDLTQNTMEKSWYKLELVTNTEAVRGWVLTIALNEIRMSARAQNTQKRALYEAESGDITEMEIAGCEQDILDQIIAKESIEAVLVALSRLRRIYREILELRLINELPFEQIANLLELNGATARVRYKRGLEYLREEYMKVSGGEKK